MADCNVLPAHQDLLNQQPEDSLTLCYFQDIASGTESCAELGEGRTRSVSRAVFAC
jgi:hypothetical protein